MSISFLDAIDLPATTVLQDLTPYVAAGKIRKCNVRFANVGAANGYGHLFMTNGTVTITRAKNYPVPFQDPGSAPDMEQAIEVPPGWKLQVQASANGVVEASVTNLKEIDIADFN